MPYSIHRHLICFLSLPLASILVLLLLFTSTVAAQSAVVGIDLGTEYIKAVLVKPGVPLEIVLAKDSKRKDPSILSIKPLKNGQVAHPETQYPERSYGSSAQALAARFPADTYPNLKQLLGLPVDTSSIIDDYRLRYPSLGLEKLPPRNTASFKSPAFGEDEVPFVVEELLAMQLRNTVENAQEMAGKAFKIKNAVFTIPPFYTIEEKAAIELAADLANLKILGTVTDGIAVGLNYATLRNFEDISTGAKPEIHMVFDVGAGYTTATILKFQGRSVKDVGRFNKTIQEVISMGVGWDRTLGGDSLNQLIVEDMANKFVETPAGKSLGKTAKDILSNGRTVARLWKDAERIRQVLSANQQTAASFEELYGDVDFKYKLSRTEFESMTTSFAERLDAPFKNALKMASLNPTDIDSIILHGGTTRTPFVLKRLEALIKDASKLRNNVNSDEAAVFGAAFKAAQLSPSFKVKDIRIKDTSGYSTWMQYQKDAGGKTTQQKIFTAASSPGSSKIYTVPRQDDFEIYLFQNRPTDKGSPYDKGNSGNTGSRYQSVNLTQSFNQLINEFGCNKEDITTQVSVHLSPGFGLPAVTGGTVSCEHDPIESKGVIDGVKDFLGFGGKKGDDGQKVLEDESSTESESSSSTSSASLSSSSTLSAKKSESTPKKSKKQVKTINFEFDAKHDEGITIAYVEQKFIAERLRSYDKSDEKRLLRDADNNNLESRLYRVREWIEDEAFTAFTSAPILKELEKFLTKTSAWHSEEHARATSEQLKSKLKELEDLVEPIAFRKDEATKRDSLVDDLKGMLHASEQVLETIRSSVEAAEAAEAALSSSSSSSSPSSSASSSSAPASPDSLDDLEAEQPDSPPADTDTDPPAVVPVPEFTAEDASEVATTLSKIRAWLDDTVAAQAALAAYEDPVLRSKDLAAKRAEVERVVKRVFDRKVQRQRVADELERVRLRAMSEKVKDRKSRSSSGKSKTKTVVEEAETGSGAESSSATPVEKVVIEHNEL